MTRFPDSLETSENLAFPVADSTCQISLSGSALELPKAVQPCQHLDFGLQACENKFLLFSVICYSSCRKLIQGLGGCGVKKAAIP